MLEDDRWRRLLKPGITAIAGVGGKTTVLERLGVYGRMGNLPIVITSSVPVENKRVGKRDLFEITCTEDWEEGERFCVSCIGRGHIPMWFAKIDGQGDYEGLPIMVIETLKQHHPEWYILVEADVTHDKWLKAPQEGAALIPPHSDTIIDVLNLQMLGHALTEERVAGIKAATAIMGRPEGAVITPALLAKLITYTFGLFPDTNCRRILFCTGFDAVQHRMTEALIDDLEDLKLAAIVLADGYRETCNIRQFIGVGSRR